MLHLLLLLYYRFFIPLNLQLVTEKRRETISLSGHALYAVGKTNKSYIGIINEVELLLFVVITYFNKKVWSGGVYFKSYCPSPFKLDNNYELRF